MFSKKLTKKYRAFLRLYKNLTMRKQLKNKNFSIIACNCIGGIIYHELRQPFLSPTINLFMKPKDFTKFVANLSFYLEQPITQIYEEGISYPIGLLHDVKLYFVHYPSFENAVAKWEERKQRINFSNLYIIMVEREHCTLDDLIAFDNLPYERKIVFTHKPYPQIASSYCIPGTSVNSQVRDLTAYLNKFTGARYIDKFNYVEWLNH